MTRRAMLRYFCATLLLVAQQGALTHAIWHAIGDHQTHAQAQEFAPLAGQQDTPYPATLCAFDLAFDQVLGGTYGSGVPLGLISIVAQGIDDLTTSQPPAATLSPRSRGPPVLL